MLIVFVTLSILLALPYDCTNSAIDVSIKLVVFIGLRKWTVDKRLGLHSDSLHPEPETAKVIDKEAFDFFL